MIDDADAFGLLAELAIALAGFSGVAAAFTGRERTYRPTERIRLLAVLLTSGVVFGGSGGVHTLLLAGVSPTSTFRFVSLAAAVFFAFVSLPGVGRAYRARRDPDSTSESWALHLAAAQAVLTLGLLAGNVPLGTPYLLAGAFWLQLVYGLWMFARLLLRSN